MAKHVADFTKDLADVVEDTDILKGSVSVWYSKDFEFFCKKSDLGFVAFKLLLLGTVRTIYFETLMAHPGVMSRLVIESMTS